MRRILVSIGLMLVTSASLFAQEWIEFASRDDRFTCNFPSQPKITQTTYRSLHEADLPARTYGATQGQSRYPRSHRLRDMAVPPARRQGDVVCLECRGPRRRTPTAANEHQG